MTTSLPLSQWLSPSRPDDTLIAWLGDHHWTLGQLRFDVATLTDQLCEEKGNRWALCFENSYLFTVALLATLSAGKTPVIPGHCRPSLLNEQRALFEGIVSDTDFPWSGPFYKIRSACASTPLRTPLPAIADDSEIELFTSGSTGQPKRVIKTVTCLNREARMLASHFADRLAGCRVVASVVPQHQYGLTFRIFMPLALGLPLHAAMLYYAEQFTALPSQHRYAFISSPAFLKRLDFTLTAPAVEMLFSAGGALPWKDVQQARAWMGAWPDEIYGSTETGVLAWRHRPEEDIPWTPFPDVTFTPETEGYRAHSPLIATEDGMLMDDILQFADNGQFNIVGRRGRVVKIEEKRISLSEVERRLTDIDGIREAAVIPVSRHGRQGLGALVVLDAAPQAQRQDKKLQLAWRRALIPWLEPVAIPRYWRIVDEMPVNSMNKRVYAHMQELFNETP